MSKDITSIEVTSKVVDLGASVLPLANITRAGVVVQHPWRGIGTWLLSAAAVLLAFEASPFGSGLRFPPRPSMLLWTVCGLAAIGVFAMAFARRRLVIATADGQRVTLPPTDLQFAAAVTNCIREGLEHPTPSGPHYRIDLAAKTIATLAAPAAAQPPNHDAPVGGIGLPATSAMPHGMPQAAPAVQISARSSATPMTFPGGPAHGATPPLPNGHGVLSPGEHTGPPTGPAAGMNSGYRNGAADSPMSFERDLARRLDGLASASAGAGAGGMSLGGAPASAPAHAPVAAPGFRPVLPFVAEDNGLRDLSALMGLVGRANLQHKEALLDLLRVVEDHKRGGSTSREDAKAHWQSFAEYVQQYLGNIDGLPEATQRVGRQI